MALQQLNDIFTLLRNATQATASFSPTSQPSTPQGFNPFQAIADLRQSQMNQILGHGMGRRVQRDMSGAPRDFSKPTGLDSLRPIPHSWETPSNATQYRPWNVTSTPATRANEQQVGRSGTLFTGADGTKSIVSPYGMATNAQAPANLTELSRTGEPLLAAERAQQAAFLTNALADAQFSGGLIPSAPPATASVTPPPSQPINPFTPTAPPSTPGMGDLRLAERQQELGQEMIKPTGSKKGVARVNSRRSRGGPTQPFSGNQVVNQMSGASGMGDLMRRFGNWWMDNVAWKTGI